MSGELDLVSHRAEIFRSKLIEDFHLLDGMDERGKIEAPKYYSKDASDPLKFKKILFENPTGLVRFQVYSSKDKVVLSKTDRRRNRLVNKNTKNPPLNMWADWIVESSWFQNTILGIILLNTVVLGVQAEISENNSPDVKHLRTILDIFDYVSLFVFALEIFLKWIDDFITFWQNGWNIFDFLVTFLSFIPEIMKWTSPVKNDSVTSELSVIADNLRVFRILRSLKMVSRFRQVRLIALAVAKAFQSMMFILLLLSIFAYIFAIAGVIFFDQHSQSNRTDLLYKSSFSSLLAALTTLFQLLTLDHWHDIYKDVTQVVDPMFSGFYIILWICIGSFIFRNIFVGIMVNNFQSIRNDLFNEVLEIEELKQQNEKIEKLNEELEKQDQLLKGQRDQAHAVISQSKLSSTDETQTPGDTLKPKDDGKTKDMQLEYKELSNALSKQFIAGDRSTKTWQATVLENMETLCKNPIDTIWPRDTLFRYFLLMETLQENLTERQEILKLADQCILNMHDT